MIAKRAAGVNLVTPLLSQSQVSRLTYIVFANVFLSILSYPRSGQRFFEAVRFSFAVAKIEQKLNTNQILPQNISQERPLSCIHFPINKQLTRGEKKFQIR